MIRGISFDFGFTLATHCQSVPEIIRALLLTYDVELSVAEIEAVGPMPQELRRLSFNCSMNGARAWQYGMNSLYRRWLGHFDVGRAPPTIPRDVYAAYAAPSNWRTTDQHRRLLGDLQASGFRVGLLSNWGGGLDDHVHGLGFAPYLSSVLTSSQIRVAKPSIGAFHAISSALDLSPGEVLHVGDDPICDIRGARRAGLRALLVNFETAAKIVSQAASLPGFFPI
jgi:HAD superfamily hydrolase (TIGR01549 family)